MELISNLCFLIRCPVLQLIKIQDSLRSCLWPSSSGKSKHVSAEENSGICIQKAMTERVFKYLCSGLTGFVTGFYMVLNFPSEV